MVYGVLCVFYVLVLDQISYDNSYSTLWNHVIFVWNAKLKLWKLILIKKYFGIFESNITILLNIILIFCLLLFTCPFYFHLSITTCLCAAWDRCLLNSLVKISSCVRVPVCITICAAYPFSPYSFTVTLIGRQSFFNGIEAIYYLSEMSWFIDIMVNNNIKGMWQYWQQI